MKPLEALSRLANDHKISYIENNFSITEDYELIQKSLKAFEIIKGIDKNALLQFISVCVKNQEEYELLKEVLK